MKIKDLKAEYKQGKISKAEFISMSNQQHQVLFEYVDTISETDIQSIKITRESVEFEHSDFGLKMVSPREEARIAPLETINFGAYEPFETEIMSLLSKDSKVIFDVGANIGWYSLRFAKENPANRVYAFEPLPVSYNYLQRNIALNSLGDRVTTFNHGLSDSAGAVSFYIAPQNGTNASLKNVASSGDANEIMGLVITLDQFVKNQGVYPDLIKCDVEGAELLVFRGGVNTLKKSQPIVFAELLRKWSKPFGYHPNDVIKLFGDLNYKCFGLCETGIREIQQVTEETLETNYVFLSTEKHGALIKMLENNYGIN